MPKGNRTYWIDTKCTASLLMTTAGVVVYAGASSWQKCLGRTTAEAIEYLQHIQGSVVIRKILPRYYFTPPEDE